MDCGKLERLLAGGPFGKLPPDQAREAEEHLGQCPSCRARWDAAHESAVLREAAKPQREASGIGAGVMARLRGDQAWPQGAGRPEPALPERIGGFEILGVLGRGGMGTVLKARQVSMDRVVALKILPQCLAADAAFVERFIREAHAAARLRHPHIVQAYDAGLSDGYYYFAMEYVDGTGLDALLAREGVLAPDRALGILKQTCSALWAAHDAGIIHRDIKPSNIMVDSKGDVRVTDFGLAKRTDPALGPRAAADSSQAAPSGGSPDACASEQSQALGTPAYLAPEAAKGQPVDARADLYSLGATFFHMLAGCPPFAGRDLAELIAKQADERPPALASVAPSVDPGLCAIVDRLLRKDPAERYASARDLLDALEALGPLHSLPAPGAPRRPVRMQDAPTLPILPGVQAASGAGRARGRRRAVVLAAAAAILLAGVLFLATRGRRAPARERTAPPPVPAAPVVPTPDPRERAAQDLLEQIQGAARLRQWREALRLLDRLRAEYAATRFSTAHAAEAAELRRRAEAGDPRVVTVKPVETGELLANPGIGWETFHQTRTQDKNLPEWLPSTVQYARWSWKDFEPQAGALDHSFLDKALAESHRVGQQVAFRIMCWSPDPKCICHPEWLKGIGGRFLDVQSGADTKVQVPDLDDPIVLESHLDFLRRLGQRYDGHPDIAHIDIGSVGWWGGWWLGEAKGARLPTAETQRKIVGAYLAAFRKTPLLALICSGPMFTYAIQHGAGWRADCPAEMCGFPEKYRPLPKDYPYWFRHAGVQVAWRRAPVAWETWPDMREWFKQGLPFRFIFNYALAHHGSLLCNRSAPLPEGGEFRAELTRLIRRLGYRFVLRELSHPAFGFAGEPLEFSMKWQNIGSAPCYQPYRVAYRLVGPDGQPRVLVGGVAVNQWLPGFVPLAPEELHKAEWEMPAGEVAEVKDAVTLPADLTAGSYRLSLAVVGGEPPAPVLRLGIEGRNADGWYPLGGVEIKR